MTVQNHGLTLHFAAHEIIICHARQGVRVSDETMTCTCTDCSHELRTDCINMQCECCVRQDAQDMLTHKDA